MPASEKERAIRRRQAGESVAGWIADGIRFCLDDAAHQAPLRQIVNQRLPNQIARELDGINGQFRAAKPADSARELVRRDFIGHELAHRVKVGSSGALRASTVLPWVRESEIRGAKAVATT